MDEIFKAYDIRGIYGKEIDEKLVYKIGKAYVKLIQEENPDKKKFTFAIGRDMRISSPSLHRSLIDGVLSMGADVVDIGLASTPTFYYAVAKYRYDGGMIISASHNPKEYNGVKVVRAKSYPVGLPNGLDKIRDYTKIDIPENDEKGKIIKKEGIVEERAKFALNFYDFSEIKPLKVVADTANAMGGPELESLFSLLKMNLIKMNFELDGTFPAHQADPFQDRNIIDIKKRVLDEGADLGIATDGDSDRIFFIDDKGELIEPAIIRGIISKVVLKHNPGSIICYDIRPGKITKDMIEENGGIPEITKVGHSLIKKHAIDVGAPFAGESSGHFFVKTDLGFFETPLIIALIIMDEISKSGKKISELVKPLKKYFHSGEINSEVKDKEAMMDKIEKEYGQGAKINKLDGITIEHEHYWFNVRPSNTEPKLRLNLEGDNKDLVDEMTKKILAMIRMS